MLVVVLKWLARVPSLLHHSDLVVMTLKDDQTEVEQIRTPGR